MLNSYKSECNYILYREWMGDGDTTDKCRQHQLNAGLSVMLSWWLSYIVATSEILFHIRPHLFLPRLCGFILSLLLLLNTKTLRKQIVIALAAACLLSFVSQLCPHACYRVRQLADAVARCSGGGEFVPWGVCSLHFLRQTPCFIVYSALQR